MQRAQREIFAPFFVDLNSYVRQMEWFHEHFEPLVWMWIGLAFGTFILLQFITAPFGRHSRTDWGPMIKNKWGWLIMELPSFVLILAGLLLGSKVNSATWVIGGFWLLHYFNRTFVFPFRIKSGDKKMPLFITGSAIFFNLFNGGFNAYYLAELSSYNSDWFLSWQFILGTSIFFLGMGINHWADGVLIHLRKPGETGYKIPKGGLFNLITAPNLFGEIVEWIGFAILAWNLPAFSFAIWTMANLIPRAVAHHKFYHEKFPEYPKNRKRVIPFVY
jgi:3-oxo-5-alpha-steroid 4-dehydrogenase 1